MRNKLISIKKQIPNVKVQPIFFGILIVVLMYLGLII